MVELIGIIASLFILLAFCMKDKAMIRKIDIIGAIIYVIYGILIKSISIPFMNFVLILVNIYKLVKEGKEENNEKGRKE